MKKINSQKGEVGKKQNIPNKSLKMINKVKLE